MSNDNFAEQKIFIILYLFTFFVDISFIRCIFMFIQKVWTKLGLRVKYKQ